MVVDDGMEQYHLNDYLFFQASSLQGTPLFPTEGIVACFQEVAKRHETRLGFWALERYLSFTGADNGRAISFSFGFPPIENTDPRTALKWNPLRDVYPFGVRARVVGKTTQWYLCLGKGHSLYVDNPFLAQVYFALIHSGTLAPRALNDDMISGAGEYKFVGLDAMEDLSEFTISRCNKRRLCEGCSGGLTSAAEVAKAEKAWETVMKSHVEDGEVEEIES